MKSCLVIKSMVKKNNNNSIFRIIVLFIIVCILGSIWYAQLPRESDIKTAIKSWKTHAYQKAALSSKKSFGIMFTYGVAGYLEPCGCSAKQMGGLPQRAYQLAEKRKTKDVLPIDGGYLVREGHIFDQLRFKVAMKMMKMMGYKAFGLSRYELQLPGQFLDEQHKQSEIPYLSANVLVTGKQTPLVPESEFDEINLKLAKIIKSVPTVLSSNNQKEPILYTTPATIVEINGIKVGITCFTYPYYKDKVSKRYIIYSPAFTLKSVVKELKKNCDYVVVISEGPFSQLKDTLDNNPDINLLLTGVDNGFEAGLGAVPNYQFNWANSNDIGKHFIFCAVQPNKNKFTNIITGEEIPDDKLLKEYQQVYETEFKTKLKALFFNQDFVVPAFNYVSPSTCSSCHPSAYKVYKDSMHIKSVESLKAKNLEYNPDCVGCHIVIDEKNGEFHPIICQTCHSKITTEHTTIAQSGKVPPKAVTDMTFSKEWCAQKCHNPENSQEFEAKYPEYIKKFFHGLDAKTAYGKGQFMQSKPKPYPLPQ